MSYPIDIKSNFSQTKNKPTSPTIQGGQFHNIKISSFDNNLQFLGIFTNKIVCYLWTSRWVQLLGLYLPLKRFIIFNYGCLCYFPKAEIQISIISVKFPAKFRASSYFWKTHNFTRIQTQFAVMALCTFLCPYNIHFPATVSSLALM